MERPKAIDLEPWRKETGFNLSVVLVESPN
jgi:hypothetical protein